MKRWKLCLALVLALVVLLGLASTAHAEGELKFTDSGKIKQKMPVTVLTGLGVINGYPNNTFRPTSTITRAEFCKMIATLDNGGKEPETDFSAAQTFTDTAESPLKNHIGYCVMMHYAAGKNDRIFAPDGKVTLLEAAKMLLVVLGHDPEVEGFVGENWKENVRIEAYRPRSNLFKDIDEKTLKKLDGNLSRDNAARMFYNALIANTVYVDKGVTTFTDDITIQDEIQIKDVENTGDFDYLNRKIIKDGQTVYEDKLQLVERAFPHLRAKQDTNDDFGRPCDVWMNGSQKIGPFVFREPLLAGSGDLTGKVAMTAIGEDPKSLEYYINGKFMGSADASKVAELLGKPDADPAKYIREHEFKTLRFLSSNTAASMLGHIYRNSGYTLGRSNSTYGTVTGYSDRITYYGTYNELYYNSDTGRVTVCSSLLNPARVNRYIPAQVDENGEEIAPAYVSATRLAGSNKAMAPLELAEERYAYPSDDKNMLFLASSVVSSEGDAEFAPGDVVVCSYGYDVETGKYLVHDVRRTEVHNGKITGPLTYGTGSTSTISRFYMNGEKSPRYFPIRKDDCFPYKVVKIGDFYTMYTCTLTSYKGAESSYWTFYAEPLAREKAENVAYVVKAGIDTDILGDKTYKAKLIDSAGEVVEVITDSYYGDLKDCLVSYTIDINEKYSLLKVGNSGLGSFSVKQGNAKMVLTPAKSTAITVRGDQDLDFTRERTVVANDSTLFLIGTRPDANEDLVYTPYIGIKNVPDAESTPYYNFAEKDGVATVVFIYENKSAMSSTSYGLLFKTDKDVFKTYTVGSTGYYEMEAVINDEPQTVQVTPALYESLKYGINLFSGCSTNTEGWLSAVKLLDNKYVYPITDLEPTDKGVLHINFDENGNGGEYLTVHDGVHVYAYSLRDRKLSVINTDLLSELGDVETAEDLFGANAPNVKTGCYTLHETYEGKPLAGIFIIVN